MIDQELQSLFPEDRQNRRQNRQPTISGYSD